MTDLSDPQKYELAEIVTKNSKTGITSNKRLLVIKKGHLYYYSSVPKGFKNDTKFLQTYHELPKCSIQVLNIKKINGFESNSNYFSIQFQARHMMEREDIRKTMTLQQFNFAPKNTKQMITWQFTCDNQFIKQKWVNVLQTLHSHYGKQKINIQKFFQNINKREQDKFISPAAMRSSLMVPWRQEQMKKSSSNESLRKSNLPQSFTNRSPSSTKKSLSSEQRNDIPQLTKIAIPQTTQELIQSFMQTDKLIKTKSASPLHDENIIQQDVQQSFQTPNKFGVDSSNIAQLSQVSQGKPINEQTPQQKPNIQPEHTKLLAKLQIQQIQQEKQQEISNQNNSLKSSQIIIPKIKQQDQYKKQQQPIIKQQKYDMKQIQQQNQQKNKFDISRIEPKQEQKKIGKQQQPLFKIIKRFSLQRQIKVSSPKKQTIIKREEDIKVLPEIRKITSMNSRTDSSMFPSKAQFKINHQTTFYQLIHFSNNRQYSFDKRIQAQQKLNSFIGTFQQKAVRQFSTFVQSKSQKNKGSGRFTEYKIDEALASLQIGYTKYKVAYVTTQAITINQKQRIFYNQSAVKSLKKQMKIYNKLFSLISKYIKKMSNQKASSLPISYNTQVNISQMSIQSNGINKSIQMNNDQFLYLPNFLKVNLEQLRVPLCSYIEYRGICALAYDDNNSSNQKQLDREKLNQWKEMIKFLGFNSNCFDFKQIKTNAGIYVIAYINNPNAELQIQKKQKHHNVTFQSPMSIQFLKKAKKQGASTSIQSLQRYIKGIKSIKDTHMFTCPRQQIISTLQYCYLIKFLRKFYRAAQAEIDELNFINLLLKGDSNICKLFQTAGFEMQTNNTSNKQVLGVFFQFLLYYLGISCEVDIYNFKYAKISPLGIDSKQKDSNNDKKIITSIKTYPRVIGYDLRGSQLVQSYSKIRKYIINKNKQLADKSLQLKQTTFIQNNFQMQIYPWPTATQYLMNAAQLNYSQNDYITAISKCKQFLITMSLCQQFGDNQWYKPTPSNCLPIYFLMLKCYSKFSKQKFNQILKQTIQSTVFNFGENSTMIITVFSFAGLAYFGMGEYNQAQTFLLASINIAQKIFNDYKKTKLSQLYLDLHKILITQNKIIQANSYLSKAQTIIQSVGSYEQKLNFLIYSMEVQLKLQKSIENQENSLRLLFKAENTLRKQLIKISTLVELYQVAYKIGVKYSKTAICERAIQQLWSLDTNSKILATQLAYKLIADRNEEISKEYNEIISNWSLSKEKSILIIEEQLKNYKSLYQMMTQVFLEEQKQLIAAFFKLIPATTIKNN